MVRVGTVGILTNGGDGPGGNAATYSVTKKSLEGIADRVLGIRYGWMGLTYDNDRGIISLDELIVSEYKCESGTFLGTSRANPFNINGKDRSEELAAKIQNLGIDALVVIGGDGSLRAAHEMHMRWNVPIIGIPQSIDNDVYGTSYSIGTDSAADIIQWYVNAIIPTAKAMNAVHVIKTMGRNTGHLALHGGSRAGADIILIPEFPFESKRVADLLIEKRLLMEIRNEMSIYNIVLVAENAIMDGNPAYPLEIEKLLAKKIEEYTKGEVKVRHDIIGFIQRGAPTNDYDIKRATRLGHAAVELIGKGQFGYMTGLTNDKVYPVPLEMVKKGTNRVNIHEQYDTVNLTANNGLGLRAY